MSRTNHENSGRLEQGLIIAQAVVALFVMAFFLFAPREGEPALLLPLTGAAQEAVPAILSQEGTALLARGWADGSYVVRREKPGFLSTLISDGVLVVSASAPGCGPIPDRALAERGR